MHSTNNFKHNVWYILVQTSNYYFQYTAILLIKANNRSYKDHFFVQKEATQQKSVGFLCNIDFIGAIADTHAELFGHAFSCFFHCFEGQLIGGDYLGTFGVRA